MHGAMQKLQILFPDPLMAMLRQLARVEDRPVSEIVRRAVDRDMEQRAGMLNSGRTKKASRPTFPTFDGGAVLVKAADMKAILHADDA